ncbi:bcl-2-associated transcription factor 1-like isoform X2 [Hypanus sabinus]|uniref:bcl-2-associated transcription factor 1-like isoform X2 n=1 Tax=Hypanus sabinus TaxID=79690 RepID=UPI0028C3C78A|nr:bcl-2-associated transcription factor 1-like isoform X2 [Hypanus sabinus]
MVRSNSRSHSSRSRSRSCSSSRSRSHSRSRSRKKRYRSYSRSRSRDRNYSRDYRDFRGNRGMRRPYGHRARGRGYYQGGPRYYRGGYRLNWQNRRQSRSPRRGRSRSRTPKHRFMSQRSRSRSRQSRRSSSARSPASSSSCSSSRHSRSPVTSKQHRSTDKHAKKIDVSFPQGESGKNKQIETLATDVKCDSDSIKVQSEFRKTPPIRSESWAGLSTYNDNSPRSHHSLSSLPSPCSLSPTRSVPSQHSFSQTGPPRRSTSKTSPPSSSLQHSPEQHSSSAHSASQYSPSQCSPIRKSPTKVVSAQHSVPREDARLKQFAFSGDALDLKLSKSKYLKRYVEKEESRTFVLDRDGREKDAQKERGLEKDRAKGREWGNKGGVDYGSSKGEYMRKEAEKIHLTESPEKYRQFSFVGLSDEMAELDNYRPKFQYTVTNQKEKDYESHWDIGCEEDKYNTKIVIRRTKDHDRFEDDRLLKFNVASFLSSAIKEKLKEDDKYVEKKYEERTAPKKDSISPEPVKGEIFKEFFDPCSSLPQPKTMDVRERDKMSFTEESPPRMKTLPAASSQPEVKLKMSASQLEDSVLPGSSLTTERLLSSALVHSNTKEQGFRSIFDHLKFPQFYRSSSESFIHHIVTLVHHVKEHYFKSSGMTINERFTMHQKTAGDHGTRQKSPEIHRRIDISPNSLRKHTCITEEDLCSKEEQRKAEKKLKCDAADLRLDIDRRKKEKSKEREGSLESSTSKKLSLEKPGKDQKEYKDVNSLKEGSKYRNKDQDHSSCSSSPSASPEPHEDREVRKERDDGPTGFKSFQGHTDSAVFQGRGRSRGNFQFRIKGGRGRARGAFSGLSTVSTTTTNPNVQKRSKEEEWDPEYTPKSKKYFLHDDRDDGVDYWAKRGRGRGTFPRGRGRFIFKKSSSSPKWTHDKYQGSDEKEEENGGIEDEEERKDRHKE